MVLTADEIVEKGLLTDPLGFGEKAQIGYDLTICKITQMRPGAVIGRKKNKIPPYEEIQLIHGCILNEEAVEYWHLFPGIYSLTFDQFCKLDSNHHARIVNRSSVQRAGGLIMSGVFDPGFQSQIGATLYVFEDIVIELHSRLAQFVVYENHASELYNGQYQGEKDRK